MDKKLLSILCCPLTHEGLHSASHDMLASVNKAIQKGSLTNRDGVLLDKPLTAALVTDDGKLLYPVSDGIPVLLEGESIALEQI